MSKINVLVLDENTEFLAPLEQYTLTVPTINFLGVSTNIQETIADREAEVPDIVLLASALISSVGEELLSQLRSKWPAAKFYRLTVFDDSGYDKYDSVKGFDGSVSRSQFVDHFDLILQLFQCTEE